MWLAGFFNPQSFLTAIMQSMARKNEWPLDKMCLSVEVTKKNREDVTAPPREGSYVYGLFMEGRRPASASRGCARCGGPRSWQAVIGAGHRLRQARGAGKRPQRPLAGWPSWGAQGAFSPSRLGPGQDKCI